METAATASSEIMNHPRSIAADRPAALPLFVRMCDAVESTDWDEKLIRTKWIDRVCVAIIALSLFFLVPLLASILL